VLCQCQKYIDVHGKVKFETPPYEGTVGTAYTVSCCELIAPYVEEHHDTRVMPGASMRVL
jgi:hypothetical protein